MPAAAAGSKNRTSGGRPPARQSRPAPGTVGRSPAARPPTQRVAGLAASPDGDEALDPGVFEFEPVRLTPPAEPAVEVPLFYVGDEAYMVRAAPRMDVGLEMIEIACTDPFGEAAAQRFMLLTMLGQEGYKAFRENVRDPADYAKIIAILTRLTVGAVETPKG